MSNLSPPSSSISNGGVGYMDQHFLDSKNSPIISPLVKPIRIELYNDKWLQPHGNDISTKSPHINLPSSELNAIAFEPHAGTPIPLKDELMKMVLLN